MLNAEKFIIQFLSQGYLGKGGGYTDDVFSAKIFYTLAEAQVHARNIPDTKVMRVSIALEEY